MKNIDLNNIFSESDCIPEQILFDYQDNKLSSKNKYIVEKHIANCEICSDALEGLALITNRNKIKKSIKYINSSIDKHTFQKKQKTISISMPIKLAIAATIAILIGISFLFTQYLRKHHDKILAENHIKESTNKDKNNLDNLPVSVIDSETIKEKTPQNNKYFKKTLEYKHTFPVISNREEENDFSIPEIINQPKRELTGDNLDFTITTNNSIVYKDDFAKNIDSIKTIPLEENINDKEAKNIQNDADLSSGISGKDEAVYSKVENKKPDKKKITKISEIIGGYTKQNESNRPNAPATNETSIITNETFNLALEKFNTKDYITAKQLFNQILINDNSNYNALYYKSVCSFNLEETDDALNGFNEVLKIEKGAYFDNAKWYKALALIKKGEQKEAKKILEEIIKSTSPFKINAEQKIKEI
jgi:tetratricopeptide (TPR) repeat protein